VVEPRVMQVLVMLARADGAIVSRDELTEGCWEGRIVGEDAINRVISRLRKVADGVGAGSFRIETVTKVGYRLARPGDPPAAEAAIAGLATRRPSRRLVLAGGGAVAGAAAIGFWLWPRRQGQAGPPDEVAPLMAQAGVALRQGTVEGNSQALGLLRQVVALRPDYADGWGELALGYAYAFYGRGGRNDPGVAMRARAAVARATELDPHNPYAMAALATLLPQMGNWRQREAILRSGLPGHGDNDILLQQLGFVLGQVGRYREGAALLDRAVRLPPPTPNILYAHIIMLWGAERLEEVDQALERALALFPTHFALWFARFYTYLFTGRAAQAAQWCGNVQGRPTGIPESEFAIIEGIAGAMVSRRPDEVERALAASFAAAHHGSGHAENCIQHACGLGRVDMAFTVADALYFGRGFDPGEIRFNAEAATYTRYSDRRTYFLFLPHTAPMRADPRFAALTERLGLNRYWSETRAPPDFHR
jgi:Flp pilus assembly protein TadD